jgi:hypothetical protein
VPTNDVDVKVRLRELEEPICKFDQKRMTMLTIVWCFLYFAFPGSWFGFVVSRIFMFLNSYVELHFG